MGTRTARTAVEDRPDTTAGLLAATRDRRRTADAAEADLLVLAVEWVLAHPADSLHEPATFILRGCGQTDLQLAGDGTPTVAEYAVPEFAAALGLSTEAGKWFLGEALELCYRLPKLWRRVQSGDLPAWKARRVARETTRLTPDAAAFVDRHLAPVAHRVKPAQLDRLVNEAIGRYMPEEVERLAEASWDKRHVTLHEQLVSFTGTMHLDADLDIADALDLDTAITAGADLRAQMGSHESLDVRRAQALGDLARGQQPLDLLPTDQAPAGQGDASLVTPRAQRRQPRQVVLHVHLSEAAIRGEDPVATLERGNALIWVDHVKAWCRRPDTQVVVKPVLDLNQCVEADSDTVPDRIKEHVDLRDATCVFPWCTRPARRCDHDHVIPRGKSGPTCSCNIAPLCRRHHRLKTHAPWTYTALDPGTYLWTSPHGYQFLRDPGGTVDVTRDRPPIPDP
jgi:hypothetical protein